jgi:hypothetical protein
VRTRLWLRWHRRHGPHTLALVNRWPVTVTGVVPMVPEYTCPCGKVWTP